MLAVCVAGIVGNLQLLLSRIIIAALLYVGVSVLVRNEELREICEFLFKRKKTNE